MFVDLSLWSITWVVVLTIGLTCLFHLAFVYSLDSADFESKTTTEETDALKRKFMQVARGRQHKPFSPRSRRLCPVELACLSRGVLTESIIATARTEPLSHVDRSWAPCRSSSEKLHLSRSNEKQLGGRRKLFDVPHLESGSARERVLGESSKVLRFEGAPAPRVHKSPAGTAASRRFAEAQITPRSSATAEQPELTEEELETRSQVREAGVFAAGSAGVTGRPYWAENGPTVHFHRPASLHPPEHQSGVRSPHEERQRLARLRRKDSGMARRSRSKGIAHSARTEPRMAARSDRTKPKLVISVGAEEGAVTARSHCTEGATTASSCQTTGALTARSDQPSDAILDGFHPTEYPSSAAERRTKNSGAAVSHRAADTTPRSNRLKDGAQPQHGGASTDCKDVMEDTRRSPKNNAVVLHVEDENNSPANVPVSDRPASDRPGTNAQTPFISKNSAPSPVRPSIVPRLQLNKAGLSCLSSVGSTVSWGSNRTATECYAGTPPPERLKTPDSLMSSPYSLSHSTRSGSASFRSTFKPSPSTTTSRSMSSSSRSDEMPSRTLNPPIARSPRISRPRAITCVDEEILCFHEKWEGSLEHIATAPPVRMCTQWSAAPSVRFTSNTSLPRTHQIAEPSSARPRLQHNSARKSASLERASIRPRGISCPGRFSADSGIQHCSLPRWTVGVAADPQPSQRRVFPPPKSATFQTAACAPPFKHGGRAKSGGSAGRIGHQQFQPRFRQLPGEQHGKCTTPEKPVPPALSRLWRSDIEMLQLPAAKQRPLSPRTVGAVPSSLAASLPTRPLCATGSRKYPSVKNTWAQQRQARYERAALACREQNALYEKGQSSGM